MNKVAHEAGRLMRIEGVSVAGDRSADGYPMAATDRPDARTGVQSTLTGNLNYGDRLVIFGNGDNEYPVAIGFNPWVF